MTTTHAPIGFASLLFRHGGMVLILPFGMGLLLAANSVFLNRQAGEFEQQGVAATAEVAGTSLSNRQ